MSGLHFHPLRVRDVRLDTDDAIVVSFDVPPALMTAFDFMPGQYLTLRHEVDGQDLRRSYSICAAAGQGLRVGVRRVPGGAFSTWLHQALKPGDTLQVMEPEGRFGLELLDDAARLAKQPRGRGKPPARAPKPAAQGPARKLVFALDEVDKARLVPNVKF